MYVHDSEKEPLFTLESKLEKIVFGSLVVVDASLIYNAVSKIFDAIETYRDFLGF